MPKKRVLINKKRVIGWSPNNFLPRGQMWDLFESGASVKIAGGTYDAGKTFSSVAYMHWLAIRYAGSRMTFVHRSLNRVYRNIVPSYEKFLGLQADEQGCSEPDTCDTVWG